MEDLHEAFNARLSEVNTYLDFLGSLEAQAQKGPPKLEGAESAITAEQQKILYSSVYLQLYNLIESTMTKCIEKVSKAAFNDGQWHPADLSQTLRKEWIRATVGTHKDLTAEHRLQSVLTMCEQLLSTSPISSGAIEKGGGGNWDDDSIESISIRLGCDLAVTSVTYKNIKRPFRDDLGPLKVVKQLRNNLAHGTISFVECAETETVSRLIDLKEKTAAYLFEVINCFEAYISNFQFLHHSKRPAPLSE